MNFRLTVLSFQESVNAHAGRFITYTVVISFQSIGQLSSGKQILLYTAHLESVKSSMWYFETTMYLFFLQSSSTRRFATKTNIGTRSVEYQVVNRT